MISSKSVQSSSISLSIPQDSYDSPRQSFISQNLSDIQQQKDKTRRHFLAVREIKPSVINYKSPFDILIRQSSQSKIVSKLSVLKKFFDQQFTMQLLYRASENGYSVKEFHKKCDQYQNTLILCKIQSHRIIGGFTPLKWKPQYQKNKTFFKTDLSNQTFLFSVTNSQKYNLEPSKRNKAICCFTGYGPTFGGGYDLCIGDNSITQPSCESQFPKNYSTNKNYLSNKNYSSNTNHQQRQNIRFTGCVSKNFQILQWQVFHIKFDENIILPSNNIIKEQTLQESLYFQVIQQLKRNKQTNYSKLKKIKDKFISTLSSIC